MKEFKNSVTEEMSDSALAHLVITGNQDAFAHLLERYHKSVFNFIYRFLNDYDQACDIAQLVFMRFYTSLPSLELERPFKPWLFQVAHNCCVDEVRRKRRQAIEFSRLELENSDGELLTPGEMPDTDPSPEEVLERRELQELLQKAIMTLPAKFRAVVVLRYTAQLRFAEIGRVLGMPEATAKTYFARAKLRLRKLLVQEPDLLAV